MSRQDRTALIEAFTAAWNAKDVDGLMEIMADDCEFRASVGPEPGTSYVGRDEVRRGYEQFLAPSDDPAPESSESAPLLVGDDFAVTRWTLRWPQPDGPPTEVRGCDVFEFAGDRIRLKDTYRKVAG
jgi:ketosteroid isomerase-like protein